MYRQECTICLQLQPKDTKLWVCNSNNSRHRAIHFGDDGCSIYTNFKEEEEEGGSIDTTWKYKKTIICCTIAVKP